ncbi:MAG: hypothetical protein U0326_35245 [Polyangiales bacterium]
MVKLLGVGAPGDIENPRSLPALVARMKRVEAADVAAPRAWGDHHDRLFLVLPRCEGRSLSGWIAGHRKARTRPAIATAQRIFDRVAGALDAARQEGSVAPIHGALSPRSVLMRREGPGRYAVSVLDFGVAPLLVPASGDHPLDDLSRAPEQSPWAPEAESPRTDVFALALLLAEVLGTTQPAPTPWASMGAEDASKLRARLASLRSDVPHAIWDLVARAMSVDPMLRPANPGEFRSLLQQSWKKLGLWEKAALTPEPEPPETPTTADAPLETPRTLFGEARRAQPDAPAPPPAQPPAPSPAQPIALPVAQPAPLPVAQPIALPVAQPAPLPMAQPIALPVAQPAPLPIAAPLPYSSPPTAPLPSHPSALYASPPTAPLPSSPATLPISPPSLAPPRSMQGLGGAPLGGPTPRPQTVKGPTLPPPPPFYDDTPTMLPGQMNPLAAAASAVRASTPAPVEPPRRYAPVPVSESTSVDVRLPLGEGPEETTGEDPPPFEDEAPFEDPSPTPPDGMPAVLTSTPDSKGFRLGARLSSAAPPPAPPAEAPKDPPPQPAMSRFRARTIGHEEAAGLALILESSQSEGTQMIQLGRNGVGEPAPRAEVPESGDPFANRAFEGPSRPMPVVERTMAIDLSASGVSSDGLAAPTNTLPAPLQFGPPPPARPWGAAPEAMQPQPQPAARSMVVWWVVGGVAVAVILMALTIALRA